MASSLTRLLDPGSVAFIGGARARLAAEQTSAFGFRGQQWVVHPDSDFSSLSDLPEVPDAVFVAVAADKAIGVIAEAAELGVGGVIAYPAGFSEAGDDGKSLQASLVLVAGDMPVLGPNCHGFVNARTGAVLWPDIHGCRRVDTGVAIVTQSGNLAIDMTMQQRGLPIATVITTGNQATVTVTDCLSHLVEDPTITAIGLHIEGLPDSISFAKACLRARELGKPIVVLKTGVSRQGSIIANTHTASIAGPAEAHRALFARYGVTDVSTPEELLGALSFLHTHGPPVAKRIVSLSCSGGEAQLMADLVQNLDISFPPFPEPTKLELRTVLDGRVALENPLDYHTFIWGDPARLKSCFTAAMASGVDMGILVIDFPPPEADADWWPTLDAFIDSVHHAGVAGIVTSTMPEGLSRQVCDYLIDRGVTPLPGMFNCLRTLDRVTARTDVTELHVGPPATGSRGLATEADAKAILLAAGLPVPEGRAVSADTAAAAATEVGFPVALKSLSVSHRSDVGGVALGLTSVAEVQEAASAMNHLGDRFLVERMVPDVIAELLVGIRIEPPVGWTLTLAAGGVLAELLADTATILLPSSRDDIRTAIESLTVSRIISGYRSGRPGDLERAIDVVLRLSELAVERQFEIEINPLMICVRGAWIADTLMETWT